MKEPDKEERRLIFEQVIPYINAIEFSKPEENPKVMYLLSLKEEVVKRMVYFFQSYDETGFSFILEKLDEGSVDLKMYEPETDKFHVKENVVVRDNILDIVEKYSKEFEFFSVGMIDIESGSANVEKVKLKIPLKSLTITSRE
jgi:hypothetical protein